MGIMGGLIDKIKGIRKGVRGLGFRTFTELAPGFTPWEGGVAEQELTRAAIERFATACSKLKPEYSGASESVRRLVCTQPNDMMSWPGFLKRTAAIYDSVGTAFVVPSYADDMRTVKGIWPLLCESAELVEYQGDPWLSFSLRSGGTGAYMLSEVAVLTKFQLNSDLFGEPSCLGPTMRLIHAQNQAQDAAIKNGAQVRFLASVSGQVRPEDLAAKREKFIADNFGPENNGGVIVHDTTISEVRQLEPQSYVISDQEMARIQGNVCNYFGISEAVLKNDYSEEQWGAWYEGRVEPFAVELGEALSAVLFSPLQLSRGNRLTFSSNRLEYASNASKRNMVRDMLDRGVMSLNEAREVLQLPPVEGGEIRVIRGEYVDADTVSHLIANAAVAKNAGRMPRQIHEKDFDLEGDDDIYNDSDGYGKGDFDD